MKRTITLLLVALIILGTVAAYVQNSRGDNAYADTSGPPTVQDYLMQINANTAVVKWLASALGTIFVMLAGAVVYIFKTTVKELKESMNEHEMHLKEIFDLKLGTVDRKADIALNKTDIIERDFVSITSHDRMCPGKQ